MGSCSLVTHAWAEEATCPTWQRGHPEAPHRPSHVATHTLEVQRKPLIQSADAEQALPAGHGPQRPPHVPPPAGQRDEPAAEDVRLRIVASVSAVQTPEVHLPLTHALSVVHLAPGEQRGQPEAGAPQSVSCSSPSLALFVQWEEEEHETPGAQRAHRGPPQSPPGASSACAIPSEQEGAAQKPLWHDLLVQSDPAWHLAPTLQRWHLPAPPQSISTSTPLRTPSEQVAARHVLFEALHTPEEQSAPRVHPLPIPQGEQMSPPPSTQVSCPFLTPSEQVACGTHSPLTQVDE